MSRRLSRRAWWHRKISSARQPATRLQAACDYLRAVAAAKDAPREMAMRLVLPLADDIRAAADEIEAALPPERKEGRR